MCHPSLQLVAGWDAERPAIRIFEIGGGEPREIGVVRGDAAVYGDVVGWERFERIPSAAWHPEQPLLVVADRDGTVQWTPDRISPLASDIPLRGVAFSPDGKTLWTNPGSWWDTGMAVHPAGGLVATLQSDQGATLVLFARVDGAVPRPRHRVLVLDCDDYQTPIFSADGRHFAVRGNAYHDLIGVYEFPSLRQVAAISLEGPAPWARHNVAFTGSLWIGSPRGTLLECRPDGELITEHGVLTGSGVSAVDRTAEGALIVAGTGGELVIVPVPAGQSPEPGLVTVFLGGTTDAPDAFDLDTGLSLTDGRRSWDSGDLATVTEAGPGDPSWLQIQAAMNRLG